MNKKQSSDHAQTGEGTKYKPRKSPPVAKASLPGTASNGTSGCSTSATRGKQG